LLTSEVVFNMKSYLGFKSESIGLDFALVRKDGMSLYANHDQGTTIGALASGIWQAALALTRFTDDADEKIFCLSFDTSSTGVYILPIQFKREMLYIAALFKNEVNVGKVKYNLKRLQAELQRFMDTQLELVNSEPVVNEREGYLFENISDAEINTLFNI
jgi:hypothetical protein